MNRTFSDLFTVQKTKPEAWRLGRLGRLLEAGEAAGGWGGCWRLRRLGSPGKLLEAGRLTKVGLLICSFQMHPFG